MSDDNVIWVWMIYAPHSEELIGAIRRCERAHWTAASARAELYTRAGEMRIGRIKWDEVDERTLIGRSDLDYVAVVTSVLLPNTEPPADYYLQNDPRARA